MTRLLLPLAATVLFAASLSAGDLDRLFAPLEDTQDNQVVAEAPGQ